MHAPSIVEATVAGLPRLTARLDARASQVATIAAVSVHAGLCWSVRRGPNVELNWRGQWEIWSSHAILGSDLFVGHMARHNLKFRSNA